MILGLYNHKGFLYTAVIHVSKALEYYSTFYINIHNKQEETERLNEQLNELLITEYKSNCFRLWIQVV